jgi:hypothetical protein
MRQAVPAKSAGEKKLSLAADSTAIVNVWYGAHCLYIHLDIIELCGPCASLAIR